MIHATRAAAIPAVHHPLISAGWKPLAAENQGRTGGCSGPLLACVNRVTLPMAIHIDQDRMAAVVNQR